MERVERRAVAVWLLAKEMGFRQRRFLEGAWPMQVWERVRLRTELGDQMDWGVVIVGVFEG